MPNPREEGRKLDFVFLFVRTTLARLGDTGSAQSQSSRASAPIVAHAVKMILDLGRRSVVLAASHVIALGRLILPSFVSLVQSLSPAPVHSHRSLGSRQLSRTSCHLAVVPRSPILST